MPGRRSISLEPENTAVASPRRSSRIKITHQDSPIPAGKIEQELPAKRTRRSSSIQEKSLSDIREDLKKTIQKDDEKPKTPARRTRRSVSAQEEQKPPLKELTLKLTKPEIKEDITEDIKEDIVEEKEIEEAKTPPDVSETLTGRPKRRVTRSMSRSPVSLKNSKPPAPATRSSRRLSLNDKPSSDSKIPTLDIIAEIESEQENVAASPPSETDALNNNKKIEVVEQPEKTIEVVVEKPEKTIEQPEKTIVNEEETEVLAAKTEILNESIKEILNTSLKNVAAPSPRRSPRVKSKESAVYTENDDEPEEEKNKMETEVLNETDADKLNKSNISIVGNTSIIKRIETISKNLDDDDDERPQNISLVNDDGRSYSPLIPKIGIISIRLSDCRKSLNNTSTPEKLNVSGRNTSQNMEALQISLKDDDDDKLILDETDYVKDISANLDTSKSSTPVKSINDSIASVKSVDSGKKSNKSTPIKTTDDKENDDMNKISSTKKTSSSKRASINELREQILDDYIATFTAEKKRKREEMDGSDSSEKSKKRCSGQMKTVISCNFSDDEESTKNLDDSEESNDEELRNEFIFDTVSVGSEDTPSIGSNDIIDEGESIGSSMSDNDSNETYENDSFVVDDDEVEDEELLSGTEDFLGKMQLPKRKRIMKMDSDSESEEDNKLENMSTEPYGGLSPSNLSEKQISSVDSDLESVRNRNEELSKQIEDGTLIPEVEKPRKMDDAESDDDDIMIVENANDESIIENMEKTSINENEDVSQKIQDKSIEIKSDISTNESKSLSIITSDTQETEIQPNEVKIQSEEEQIVKEVEIQVEKEQIEIQSEKEQIEDEVEIQSEEEKIEDKVEIQSEEEEIEDEVEIQSEEEKLDDKVEIQSEEEQIEDEVEIQSEEEKLDDKVQIQSEEEVEIQSEEEEIEDEVKIQSEEETKIQLEEEQLEDEVEIQSEEEEIEDEVEIQSEEETKIQLEEEQLEDEVEIQSEEETKIQLEEEQPEEETDLQPEEDEPEKLIANENEVEEDKETKYKKIVDKYFNVTNKNRSRRQTIGEETTKTPSKPSRKRKTSLDAEFLTHKEETFKSNTNEPQIIEVNIGSRKSESDSDRTFEFNNSGVYRVSPKHSEKPSRDDTHNDDNESLFMIQDFDDSLNESLNDTSASQKQKNKTPVKSSEESENSNTGSSKKKRKKMQLNASSVNEDEIASPSLIKSGEKRKSFNTSSTENIVEEIPEKKKRKQNQSNENEKTEESVEEHGEETSGSARKKKRKMKKKLNKTPESTTDSEKENSTSSPPTPINKSKKSPENMFNFKVQNGKMSPSKSELEYTNYVPPKHRNIYKNLIKPSSSGFSGSSQFVIKDLVAKVSHGIKKQKYTTTKLNKASISGMVNCANWKETLLGEDIVKNIKKMRKHKH